MWTARKLPDVEKSRLPDFLESNLLIHRVWERKCFTSPCKLKKEKRIYTQERPYNVKILLASGNNLL
jgi:hypothetical protein